MKAYIYDLVAPLHLPDLDSTPAWRILQKQTLKKQFPISSVETHPNPPSEPMPPDFREEIQRMIGRRLNQHRAAAWEDDISRNSLDDAPFENLPAPCEFSDEDLKGAAHTLAEELRQSILLREWADRDSLPIPSPEDREGYSRGHDAQYWLSGLNDYWKVMRMAESLGTKVERFFDFGCASGRVLRHVACQSKVAQIWGSDINARHIRWLWEFMPNHVRPIANYCLPTLPLSDASIDVVTAFSVFTHIDTFETCWLAELNRILRPGGMAYLTVHNEATWEALRREIDNPNNRLVQSVLKTDPGFAEAVHKPMPDTRRVYRLTKLGPYRAQVFHSNNYLHRVWGRFFEIRKILDCDHVRQSVVVLSPKK